LGLLNPFFELRLNLRKVDEDMGGLANIWGAVAGRAPGIYKLRGVYELTAAITLVTLSIIVTAHWACSTDVSISQESIALSAIKLLDFLNKCISVILDVIENLLCNLSVLRS